MLHINPLFKCYFGDAKDQLEPKEYLALSSVQDILLLDRFAVLKKRMHIDTLFFLRQTHSIQGMVLKKSESESGVPFSFAHEGDYIITDRPGVGIGVMTADCVPLIIFDTAQSVIGVAHAGWRGTVAGIAVRMLTHMQAAFGTELHNVVVYFGPSAKKCCYEVQPSFKEQLAHLTLNDAVMHSQNGQFFFDKIVCNKLLLEEVGVKKESFHEQYNVCTICDPAFYSHRRGSTGRQMTVACVR